MVEPGFIPRSNRSRALRPNLCKVVVRRPYENLKLLRRLIKKYKPEAVAFFLDLNRQQVRALKVHGEAIAIVYDQALDRRTIQPLRGEGKS